MKIIQELKDQEQLQQHKLWSIWIIFCSQKIICLPDNLSFEQGASVLGNSVTVTRLEEAKELKAETDINTDETSVLVRQFVRYFKVMKLMLLISSKENIIKYLKSDGAKYILIHLIRILQKSLTLFVCYLFHFYCA